jgi:hypothetical protein
MADNGSNADADVIIALKATVDQLREDLKEAQSATSDFGDGVMDTFKEIGGQLVAAFSVYKIAEFVKDSVAAFGDWEEALERLGGAINRSGTSWDSVKDKVVSYAKQIGETTKFSDDQVIASLNAIMVKTNDYSSALQLNNLAMKLSKATGEDLVTAGGQLALAYEGNTRGLSQISRQLGITGADTKDAASLFKDLQARLEGVDVQDKNLNTTLAENTHEWAELEKEVGGGLKYAVQWISVGIMDILKALESLPTIIGETALEFTAWAKEIMGNVGNVATFMTEVWKHPVDAWHNMMERKKAIAKQYDDDILQAAKVTADELSGIWEKQAGANLNDINVTPKAKSGKSEGKEDYAAELENLKLHNRDILEDDMATQAEKQALLQQEEKASLDVVNKEEAADKDHNKSSLSYENERLKIKQDYAKQIKKLATDEPSIWQQVNNQLVNQARVSSYQIGDTWAQSFERIGELAKNHQVTMTNVNKIIEQSFVELGKAMFKNVVNAIAGGLIQQGNADLALGVAATLAQNYPMAAMDFAAGASLDAAGGAMMGLATAFLAEGGIVDRPTRAVIGEAGPEAVMPLSQLNNYGGTTIGDVHQHNHYNSAPSRSDAGVISQTQARALMSMLQQVYLRTGQKNSGGY